MVRGKMCVSVGKERIMCRIDPILHEELIQKKGCRTVVMKGRELKGYVYVQEDSMPAKKDIDFWIGLALDFNKNLKSIHPDTRPARLRVGGIRKRHSQSNGGHSARWTKKRRRSIPCVAA